MSRYHRTRAGQARARAESLNDAAQRIDNERNSRLRIEIARAQLANPEAGLEGALAEVAKANGYTVDLVRAAVTPKGWSW